MKSARGNGAVVLSALVIGVLMRPTIASGAVRLELRVDRQLFHIGNTLEVGLYAVSELGADQLIAGIDAIIGWDSAVLEFVDKTDRTPLPWLISFFPDDRLLDGLNADCDFNMFCPGSFSGIPFSDGTLLYQAIASTAPNATRSGFLVTTLVFRAIGVSDATSIAVLPAAGTFTVSRVLDGDPINFVGIITGTLGSIAPRVAACGSAGDYDVDCAVGLPDVAEFATCLTGPSGGVGGVLCQPGDVDGDLDVDLRDWSAMSLSFRAP